jgi:hypothetical protein
MVRQADTVGAQINKLLTLRKKYMAATAKASALEDELKEAKESLIQLLHEKGLEGGKSKRGSVAISTKEYGYISNPDEFHKWMYHQRAAYLLERRLAQVALRELIAKRKGKPIPGVQTYQKETLRLTEAKPKQE